MLSGFGNTSCPIQSQEFLIYKIFLLSSLSKLLFHISCIKFTEKCNQTSGHWFGHNFPYRQAMQGRKQGRRAGAGHTGVAGGQGGRRGRHEAFCVWEGYIFPTLRSTLWRCDQLTQGSLSAGVKTSVPLFCARLGTYCHCLSLQPSALVSFWSHN